MKNTIAENNDVWDLGGSGRPETTFRSAPTKTPQKTTEVEGLGSPGRPENPFPVGPQLACALGGGWLARSPVRPSPGPAGNVQKP